MLHQYGIRVNYYSATIIMSRFVTHSDKLNDSNIVRRSFSFNVPYNERVTNVSCYAKLRVTVSPCN